MVDFCLPTSTWFKIVKHMVDHLRSTRSNTINHGGNGLLGIFNQFNLGEVATLSLLSVVEEIFKSRPENR